MSAGLLSGVIRSIERKRYELELQWKVLHALDPAALFDRGYAFVSIEGESLPVRNIEALARDQHVRATFNDGSALARILSTTPSHHTTAQDGGHHE